MELAVISLASLLAGFLDSIVGGGGLVLVPAMFATFPSSHPATLLGTNKGTAIWGTGMAAWQYSRRVDLRWAVLLPAAALGFAGSMGGAWAVTLISPDFLRKGSEYVQATIAISVSVRHLLCGRVVIRVRPGRA